MTVSSPSSSPRPRNPHGGAMPYTPNKPVTPPSAEDLRARIPGWGADLDPADRPSVPKERSEEHTSELQSLMRTSYAVFCLNKKITEIKSTNSKHIIRHSY